MHSLWIKSNWPYNDINNLSTKYCLFGTVKLVRNTIKSKFNYNSRGIAFDGEDLSSFDNDFARNVVTLGIDNSSSSHTNNEKKSLHYNDDDSYLNVNETENFKFKEIGSKGWHNICLGSKSKNFANM